MAARRTVLTSNGRITIPAEIRHALQLEPGERLQVERQGERIIIQRATSVAEQTAGIFARYRKPVPLTREEEHEAFMQAVAKDVAGKVSSRQAT